jgi:hypothetical protein
VNSLNKRAPSADGKATTKTVKVDESVFRVFEDLPVHEPNAAGIDLGSESAPKSTT